MNKLPTQPQTKPMKTDTDTDTTATRGRDPTTDKPTTVLVELPGAPPEGKEWVGAFRQPLPMAGMAKLCTALADSYGKGARLHPCGDWVAVSGDLRHDSHAKPTRWRVCEVMPSDGEDGGAIDATTPEDAVRELAKRHPQLAEYLTLYVWPDGEEPGPDNLLAVETANMQPPLTPTTPTTTTP